jgi:hypothetical protein
MISEVILNWNRSQELIIKADGNDICILLPWWVEEITVRLNIMRAYYIPSTQPEDEGNWEVKCVI